MSKFLDLLPELRTLVKQHNFIRISALLRQAGHTKLFGCNLNDFTEREFEFQIERMALAEELNAAPTIVLHAKSVFTKTELNKLKKAEVVEIALELGRTEEE